MTNPMTPFQLSSTTIAAIETALGTNGLGNPGTNNINYLTAYNDIYADLVAYNNNPQNSNNLIGQNILDWFSQAGLVNTEQYQASQAGAFIWGYTEAAAISEGATISTTNMQAASNDIALTVFKTLAAPSNNFLFNSNSGGNFSIQNIIAFDAGAGVQDLKTDYQSAGLDNAIWGGTLFATTELNDPTYFSDFSVTVAPGSRDAAAILAGFETGSVEALQVHPGVNITNLQNTLNLDVPTLVEAALATNAPSLLSGWLSNPTWTLGANASSPTTSGNQVASGNIEIYNNVTGDALTLTGATNSAGIGVVYQPTGTTGSMALPTASSVEITDGSSNGIITYGTVNTSNGNVSFVDETGHSFASYTAGQAAGDTIQITSSGINVYNSANQIQDSTQDISIGNGASAALDRTYSNTTGFSNFTTIDYPTALANGSTGPFETTMGSPSNNGILVGDASTNYGAPAFIDQNGQFTAINLDSLLSPTNLLTLVGGVNNQGTVVGTAVEAGSSSPNEGFVYQNGQITFVNDPNDTTGSTRMRGINDSGAIVGTYMSSSGFIHGFVDNSGVFTDVSYGTNVGTLVLGIDDNGVIVGAEGSNVTNAQAGSTQGFIDNNGAFTTVRVPDSNPGQSGQNFDSTYVTGINDSGVAVGYYLDPNENTYRGFIDNNGVFTTYDAPGAPILANAIGGTYITGINDQNEITGYDYTLTNSQLVSHGFTATDGSSTISTSVLEVAQSGTVDLRNVTQIASTPTTINLAAGNNTVYLGDSSETVNGSTGNDAFNVTSATIGATINGGAGQNALDIAGGGTVTMGSNITNINTVNLAAAPSGQNQPDYHFTANGIAGLVVTDSSAGSDTLTAGNVSGDTLSVFGSHGNNTLTVQDILSNNPGANWNNTLNAATSSGNNTLTVGDGSYDLLRTDWSTGANSLTAGNGSHNRLNAESSTGTEILSVGSGTNNTLDVSFSSGNDTLSTVNGSSDYLNASSSAGNNTLTAGNGSSNTLDVSFSTGVNSLTAGDGNSDWLNAESSQKANTLVAGNGNSDTLDVSFSSGNNTATAGNGNGDYLNASTSTGNNILTAGSGANDTFSAVWSTGQNTFNAGTGNTTLFGGEGYTTYKFGSAFGQDVLWNSGSSSGQGASAVQGAIDFTSGVSLKNLWFTQSGNDLVVRLLGTSDTITVKGWFGSNAGAEVQSFNAFGLTMTNTHVAALVSAMATYQASNFGFNPATATQMPTNTALQSALATAWSQPNDSVTVNADGSWTQTLNDTVSGNWSSIANHYTTANQLNETNEVFNNSSSIDTVFDLAGAGHNVLSVSGILPSGTTVQGTAGNTVNISGNGQNGTADTVNMSGGTVAAAGNTNSIIVGSNDTITSGTSATLTVGTSTSNSSGNSITFQGGDIVTINSSTDIITGNGTNAYATINGGSETFYAYGTGGSFVLNGANAGVLAQDNGETFYVNGTGDSINLAGVNDGLLATGTGETIYVTGTGGQATLTGAGEGLYVNGSGVTVYLESQGGIANMAGNNEGLLGTANSQTVYMNGTGDSVTLQGNNYGVLAAATGGGETIYAEGSGGGITLNSNNNGVLVSGNSDTVYVHGTGSTIHLTGNNNAVILYSLSNTVVNSGTGNIVYNSAGVRINAARSGLTSSTATDVTVASNDTIYGSGNDIYQVGSSFANVKIFNDFTGGGTAANGEVDFTAVDAHQLWFERSGNDLIVDQLGTANRIDLAGWYIGNVGAQVKSFDTADGLKLDTQVAQLVSAMASYSAAHSGFNPATATAMPTNSALQTEIAAAWHT